MTTDEALAFLREHPRISANAPQEVVEQLDEVRKCLTKHPDVRCIPLVLGVFGDHMGWSIFQRFDDVLRRYSTEQLTPHLVSALQSEHRGIRWWAAHWAMEWPRAEMLPALLKVLDSVEDEDAHYFCLAAVGDIYRESGDSRAIDFLRKRASHEEDPERKELIRELLNGGCE